MTTQQLTDELIAKGGAIVCSGDCTEIEIAAAQSCYRFASDANGFGFVRRPKDWLTITKNRELAHPMA